MLWLATMGGGGGTWNYYNITIEIYNEIRELPPSPEQKWSVIKGGGGTLTYYNITIKIFNEIRVLLPSPEQKWSVIMGGGGRGAFQNTKSLHT